MPGKIGNIVFDCEHPRELSHFWADVLGYPRAEWPPEPARTRAHERPHRGRPRDAQHRRRPGGQTSAVVLPTGP
ncbi:VOC family protein [Cryobacterium breve]|uniref:VOC family protein n=1 Tax=Cryobacterium breve TaxID=1259258 RepID=UPI003D7C1B5F